MPGRLDRLVGQEAAVESLSQAVNSGRLAHALLIEGPTGIGKRSLAEALAAALLCRNPDPFGACGNCPACTKVDGNTHPDLTRVHPNEKNNVVIEDIRRLEHAVQLRAMEGGRKVGIVLAADRMAPPAQNALLKTLEEPPSSTHLLLVTNRPGTLLPTILSRCQRVRLRPLHRLEVERVIAERAPERSPSDRSMLAALAEGAPGRALALDLEEQIARRDRVEDLDLRIDPSRKRAPMDAIQEAPDLAKDRQLLSQLVEVWFLWTRDQCLIALGMPEEQLSYPSRAKVLRSLARQRGLAISLNRADALLEARRQIDLPFNLNATMIAEQLLLTLAGNLPLRRVPLRPVIARNP